MLVQLIKILIDFFVEKKLKLDYLRRSWGFPSVHSALLWSICTLVYIIEWPHSINFALAVAIWSLIRYDSVNVRLEAWKHAQLLNEIKIELKDILNVGKNMNMLKERLGHTIYEVWWGIMIWVLLTIVVLWILWYLNIDIAWWYNLWPYSVYGN